MIKSSFIKILSLHNSDFIKDKLPLAIHHGHHRQLLHRQEYSSVESNRADLHMGYLRFIEQKKFDPSTHSFEV
jgi:hypothetical protein